MTRTCTTFAFAALLLTAMAVHEARAGGFSFYYGPAFYPAPVVRTVNVYRPVVYAPPPVYYYTPPVYQPVVHPVTPVVYSAPAYPGYPVRVRYKRREIETKYYTPYGTHEYEVKFDRYGRVRDVDYDFDD